MHIPDYQKERLWPSDFFFHVYLFWRHWLILFLILFFHSSIWILYMFFDFHSFSVLFWHLWLSDCQMLPKLCFMSKQLGRTLPCFTNIVRTMNLKKIFFPSIYWHKIIVFKIIYVHMCSMLWMRFRVDLWICTIQSSSQSYFFPLLSFFLSSCQVLVSFITNLTSCWELFSRTKVRAFTLLKLLGKSQISITILR